MKARKIQSRAARAPMFSRSTIATAVATALIAASGAQAAETLVDATYHGTATGTPTVNSGNANAANVAASITNATVGTTSTGTPSNPNPVAASTTGNLIGATATGNSFANGIQPATPLPVNNAATLGVSTNTGVINSSVLNSKLVLESAVLQSGSVVNADNTISAATTLNSGSSVVSGTAATGAAPQAGSSVLTYPAGAQLFDAKGNIVVTSLQSATGGGSEARVQGSLVDLMLTANAGNTLSTAAVLERNSISAVLKANSATSTAEIQGSASFAGSAVVANLQANGNGILATHSAVNTGSVVMGIVSGAPAGGANVLTGSLSVRGNDISSAATGNEALGAAGVAGNRIVIGDLSVAGTGTAATAANNSTHNGVGVTTNVNSDLAIVNSQGNIGAATFAQTDGALILAGVQSSKAGAVTLSDNGITADATGNTASSAIATGKNAASFTGTAAVSNQQANFSAPVTAFITPSVIGAQTGEAPAPGAGQTSGSAVTVAGNTVAATAQGNQVTQSLALQAGSVAIGNGNAVLTGGTSSDGRVSAGGAVTMSNLQGLYDGGVAAINMGSQLALIANGGGADVANSTLAMSDNRQEAVALGNGATHTLTLSGNAVGTGAGIASVQMADANSGVGAGLSNPEARVTVNGNLAGGSATLSGNLQRAIAYGNAATNTLGVTGGALAATPSAGAASSVNVNVASGLPFDNNGATQPTVRAAYGILNDQSVQANINTSATGTNTLAVTVGGNVSDASVVNDRNALVAATYGNDAASGLTLKLGDVSGANAAVANVTNTQAVAGAATGVSAIAAGGTVVRTTVTGTLADGSVSSSGNTAQALAYGSRATGNTVAVKANNIDTAGFALSGATLTGNTLNTNAAFSVQNAQSGQGTVSAQRSGGAEVLTTVVGAVADSKIDASGNATLAGATSNSAVNGVSVDGLGVATTTAVQNLQLTSATVTSLTGQEGASLANKDGVRVVLGGASLQGSQVSVDGNAASGSATGNAAANRIDVKGEAIAVGNGLPLGGAASVAGAAGAIADHALSNVQLVTGTAPISSRVAAAFGVDTLPGAPMAGSTLSVSNNAQGAKAVANTASNAIALTATDVAARAALLSAQGSTAAVSSRSFMQAFAQASATGSSVSIAKNSNTALGVINDVDNKLSVAGGSSGGGLPLPGVALQGAVPSASLALGDQVLVNVQSAGTSATATADTALYNEDRAVPVNAGLTNSSFAITGNATYAEAAANRATNAASLAGGASQSAHTVVLNAQDSNAAVTASANNVSRLTLTGANALAGSSATLEGNSTGAAATGSAATNSLAVKSGTIAGSSALPATALAGPASAVAVLADQVLANVQQGTGAVSATATGSTGIDTAALSGVGTSTLSVSNNSQSAKAVANTALNSVALEGANVAARSALQSSQSGTAPVTASSTLELFAPAASSNSAVRLSGNSNTALAVTNDATNTLGVAAVNTRPVGSTGTATLAETGGPDNVSATGDHVLSNRQTAAATVGSTASTSIYNDDRAVAGTQGLVNGALTVSGNSTFAEASANRAANTLSVASGATQGASAGIANVQASSAAVTATASTMAGVTLAGAVPLNGGSVSIDGNSTAALARGNAATNVLESSGGAGYGPAAAVGSSSLAGTPLALNVGASAAILNSQTNTGAVKAESMGTSYQVALNGTALGAGVSNGTVGVTGNALAAQAVGNSATNRLTQTALNTGTPSAAVANYQVNTGAVTATVTSVNFGVGVSGAVGGSTLRTAGNQITASATGNASVSTISAR
ncbi:MULTISPECIES: hypothetical protein [unclassified Variovorax]|uniref:beta strand repeat-containing protein n=1 Tax=unclassified Variovorax TaxID=663243 RepID=UPI0008C95C6E|nr:MULTISPECIES: hypothetical protein [unclassified Variovorax]SEK14230.1 hypothetical protein SAMN05518853_11418 [Variovorax sp. OK202]SFD96011.1 hypothetical protein SAMN05444746_11418 [Variovorax sp. OK212]